MGIFKNQTGFSPLLVVLVVVILGVVGFTGYKVFSNQQNKGISTDTNQSASDQVSTSNDVQPAPEINSTSDLDKAQTVLDQTDTSASNDSDTKQLDSQLSDL